MCIRDSWNDRGAYVAYRAILRHLEPALGPAVRPKPYTAFRVEQAEDQGDTWAAKLHLEDLLHQESIRLIDDKRPNQLPVPILEFEGNHMARVTKNDFLPDAMVFRDSFGDALVPFLAARFHRTSFYWSRRMARPYVEFEQPDVVIQEMVERDLAVWLPTLEIELRPL